MSQMEKIEEGLSEGEIYAYLAAKFSLLILFYKNNCS